MSGGEGGDNVVAASDVVKAAEEEEAAIQQKYKCGPLICTARWSACGLFLAISTLHS